MPTVHYTSRAFLSQLGVSDPPRTADEIRTKLRRDPDYFQFPMSTTSHKNLHDPGNIVDEGTASR